MSAPTPTLSLVGGLGLLERATGYTLGSLLMVTPADLARSTPCRSWDLRMLLHHMNDSLAALHEAADTGYVDLTALPPDSGATDLVGSLRDRACRLLGTWTAARERDIDIADMSLAAGLVAATGAVEVAVHGWDVSKACGRPRDIPPQLASDLLEVATMLVSADDRPGRFAAPIRANVDLSPGGRLLAWLGRDVLEPPLP